MNEAAKQYWEMFWDRNREEEGKGQELIVKECQFGDDPKGLAQKVIDGVKTATCSAHIFYEVENEPLPVVGQYNVILNEREEPVAIVQNVDVQLVSFKEVSEAFALAEGEGTYEEWRNIHVAFFAEELSKIDRVFSEDMLLVCETFKLVDVKKEQ
ncbi:ASCH domain-containing protein [Shouchella lonarensis]|uniref:Uncharacterized protein YhfF n=1 Tax=Shouchella lonarensis TaxID=1464122 RepID=A0A1G6PAA9_9BACI|nr:ASCH domain-containing protein [Shouchella lonarensis]SDC77162.1 Uncharacterized protein YhfF [Shouchella lonarensis]